MHKKDFGFYVSGLAIVFFSVIWNGVKHRTSWLIGQNVSRQLATSFENLVAITQFLVALATSELQFRALNIKKIVRFALLFHNIVPCLLCDSSTQIQPTRIWVKLKNWLETTVKLQQQQLYLTLKMWQWLEEYTARIQLFRQRLSKKSVKAYATMPKSSLGNTQ